MQIQPRACQTLQALLATHLEPLLLADLTVLHGHSLLLWLQAMLALIQAVCLLQLAQQQQLVLQLIQVDLETTSVSSHVNCFKELLF
ncbi:TPA: hypothetical protein DCQ44_03600 [Candidatus Taylorbacteria bacterium]|nr:hypothetical protein [Candidatus Taylorbacteria bacterium]